MSLFTYWKTTFAHVSVEFLHIHKHPQLSVEFSCKNLFLAEYSLLIMSKRRHFSTHFFYSQCGFNQDIMLSPDFVLAKHLLCTDTIPSNLWVVYHHENLFSQEMLLLHVRPVSNNWDNKVGIDANLNISLSKHTCIVSTVWLDTCDSADCRDSISPYHSQPVWRDDLVSKHVCISFW